MDIKDVEIMLIAQLIDVLETLKEYNNIEDIKKDISIRIDLYKKQLKELE